ncbi:hypothetical protein F0U62_46845 [Cystobacter fuscus]|nr:hypothetical protein F0U62_46845 [Cystobacter fuscus]
MPGGGPIRLIRLHEITANPSWGSCIEPAHGVMGITPRRMAT